MATSYTPNHYKLQLGKGKMNMKAQSHNLSLTFGKASTGLLTMTITGGNNFHRPAGSFLDDGFHVGQVITASGFTNAVNNDTFLITALTATDMTVAQTLTNEGAGTGDEKIESYSADMISRAAGSFTTDGFEVGDIIYTNSTNAPNAGPFVVRGISKADRMVVANAGTGIVAMTAGTEANKTVGTYLLQCLLMREGFAFDIDNHDKLINIQTNSGAIADLTFAASTKKISRGSGSFVTDGFVAGNKITTDAALNPGPFTIVTVAALEIVVSEAVVDEGPVNKTVTSNDEYSGGGYTAGGVMSGVASLSNPDTYNYLDGTFGNIVFTASGGVITNVPGMLIYNKASADKFIVGYVALTTPASVNDTEQITISGTTIRIA